MKYRNQAQQKATPQVELKLEGEDVAVCENGYIVKPVSVGMSMTSAAVIIGGKIAEMKKQGYDYLDHIDVSPGEKVLIFSK